MIIARYVVVHAALMDTDTAIALCVIMMQQVLSIDLCVLCLSVCVYYIIAPHSLLT